MNFMFSVKSIVKFLMLTITIATLAFACKKSTYSNQYQSTSKSNEKPATQILFLIFLAIDVIASIDESKTNVSVGKNVFKLN